MFTPEAMAAVAHLRESDGIVLDGTYTGKACAAFIADARSNGDGPMLFWHTKNSRLFPPEAIEADYHMLPISFHRYFTEPVQPLDM